MNLNAFANVMLIKNSFEGYFKKIREIYNRRTRSNRISATTAQGDLSLTINSANQLTLDTRNQTVITEPSEPNEISSIVPIGFQKCQSII